jgi:hypothetical protein
VLKLTGSATIANYQTMLRSIRYNNTNGGPGVSTETVSVVAFDGGLGVSSAVAVDTININTPVVQLSPPNANNSTTWTNGGGPVLIASSGAISDVESGTLASLTATLTTAGSPQAGDVLADGTPDGSVVAGTSITSSYNSATGVLTLSGVDTLANYQAVLDSVTYNNTAGGPSVGPETIKVVANDGVHASNGAVATINVTGVPSTVVGTNLFYDNSKFNGNVEGVNAASDDKAIDTSKIAYLPGAGTATAASVSGFTSGINGVMVDLTNPGGTHSLTAADFTFKVGLNNAPSKWIAAPAPTTVSVRGGAGVGGTDRVELTWADGSITDEWLEVTVLANADTGLVAPYTFFYGSLPASTGASDTATKAITGSSDESVIRANNGIATVTNAYDVTKDGQVNSSDESAARADYDALVYLKISNITPLAPSVAPAVTAAPAASASISGDTGLASGLAALLNNVNGSTRPSLRLDTLASELKHVNLNTGVAATIFEALAKADTKLTRSILVEADKIADELGLDDSLLDSLLGDLGLE